MHHPQKLPASRGFHLSLLLAFCLYLHGCAVNQGLEEGNESGLVTNTSAMRLTGSLSAAWIYEIDDEPVPYTKKTHRLPVGDHTIKVWPVDSAPQGQIMVPDTTRIRRENIIVEKITVTVEPGYRYYIGARTTLNRTQSTVGGRTYKSDVQPVVVPVVVRSVKPVTLQEATVGFGAFFGVMLVPAVLAGGL